MKLKNNRFALIPCKCGTCQERIWLEAYKKDKLLECTYKNKTLEFGSPLSIITCKRCQKEVPAIKIAIVSTLEILRAEIKEQSPDVFDGEKSYIEKNNIIRIINERIKEELKE